MTIITEFIAETATACVIIACGAGEVEEKPPPIMRSIDDIYEEYGLYIPAEHAPYIDEQTAESVRIINEKDSRIEELETEVKRLESENKRLNNANSDNDVSSVSSDKKGGSEEKSNGTMNASATFYTAFCPTGCTGVTATGYDVSNTIYSPEGYRIIAADPSVYPLKSTVDITLENGDSLRAKVMDTGGDIKGNRIDVLVASRDEAYALGRQKASVSKVE